MPWKIILGWRQHWRAIAPQRSDQPHRPNRRAWYDALVLDRAAARGEPLDYTLTNRAYFPSTTTGYRGAVGNYATDPALFAGANPANFATGNASLDPRTGRMVGFGGGPQTSSIGSGSNPERGGIERQDLPYARAVGYTGPDVTAIGTSGPLGMDASQLTSGGWNTTVSADQGAPGGTGYVPARSGGARCQDQSRRVWCARRSRRSPPDC